MVADPQVSPPPADRVLELTRILDAPRRVVFEAWSKPEHLVRWFGPKGFTLPSCQVDFRPGGSYRLCMRSPEGTDYWVGGTYREVSEPGRLVFTWDHSSTAAKTPLTTVVTITLDDVGGKTKLTLHQDVFDSIEDRDAHRGGWSSSFERLAEYVASPVAG